MLVLVLTVTRLIWWWLFDTKSGPIVGVSAWQVSIARWTHRGLYVIVILLLAPLDQFAKDVWLLSKGLRLSGYRPRLSFTTIFRV